MNSKKGLNGSVAISKAVIDDSYPQFVSNETLSACLLVFDLCTYVLDVPATH